MRVKQKYRFPLEAVKHQIIILKKISKSGVRIEHFPTFLVLNIFQSSQMKWQEKLFFNKESQLINTSGRHRTTN